MILKYDRAIEMNDKAIVDNKLMIITGFHLRAPQKLAEGCENLTDMKITTLLYNIQLYIDVPFTYM